MGNEQMSLKEKVEQAIFTQDPHLSYDLIQEVQAIIDTIDPAKRKEVKSLERLKGQLSMVALRYFSPKKVEDLLEASILDIIDLSGTVDLIEIIQYRLGMESFEEDRNEFRDKMIAAIQRSPNLLGSQQIQLGDQSVKPSIENWFKLFISEVGSGEVTNIKLARFFSQNKSLSSLDEKDKQRLRQLISLYKYLKIRSEDVAGYEDYTWLDVGSDGVLLVGGGEVKNFYDEERMSELENQAKNGELSPLELTKLELRFPGRFEKYSKSASSPVTQDPKIIEQKSQEFINQQKSLHNVSLSSHMPKDAALFIELQHILGKRDQLLNGSALKHELADIVIERQIFTSFMRKSEVSGFILKNFPDELGQKNKEALSGTVLSPLGFQALLMIIFKSIYRISEEEALWHSYQIIERFPLELREFKTIVTYDISQNKLVWRY